MCRLQKHQLVASDFRLRIHVRQNKGAKITRTKWWKLKGDTSQVFKDRVIQEGAWSVEGEANRMWEEMVTCIRKVATEVFGVIRESRREPKDSWW